MRHTQVCWRCRQELHVDSFRRLRQRRLGVCKACEVEDLYRRELRANERRLNQAEYDNFLVCKTCGENLHISSFRALREQATGVCKACEAKAVRDSELHANERRLEQYHDYIRNSRLRLLPDD
jgi:ssDNA-binding Zn-finger/Zn-ribbon topoisomerase 1